jgi:serine protease Do
MKAMTESRNHDDSTNVLMFQPLHRESVSRVARLTRGVAIAAVCAILGAAILAETARPGQGPVFALATVAKAETLAPATAASSTRFPSFADMVERVKPAVVSVKVKLAPGPQISGEEADGLEGHPLERFFRRFGEAQPGRERPLAMSQGSGFFISADGEIVTNHHVVRGAREVEIVTDDGRTLAARVVGSDEKTDIALLKVKAGQDFPFVRLVSKAPRIGDWVVAVGNPFGLGGTVTAGIVSARGRDIGAGPYDDFLQIDAAVNRGNSGGPTFSADGEVVGMNTAIFSPSGGNVGIAFAVPAETIQKVTTALREGGTVERGFIGVQTQGLSPDIAESIAYKGTQGALVVAANRNGPAAKAGVKAGDVIVAVDGEAVKDPRDLARKIGALKPGAKVGLTIWRDGRETLVTFDLERRPLDRAEATRPDRG